MEQSREKMNEILRELQEIQIVAFQNGIRSFDISTVTYDLEDEGEGEEGLIREYGDTQERFIYVTIFRYQDLEAEDGYLRLDFNQNIDAATIFRRLNNIKAFIGLEG